jgi:hypothetical protein
VTRGELNWLLQTIKDAETAKRFVQAQYEHGRISLQLMAHIVSECGWINRTTNQFFVTAARHSTGYEMTELPVAIALEEQPHGHAKFAELRPERYR